MWLPDNTYMNICKLSQEIYKNHYKTDQLNYLEVGNRQKSMICVYMLEMPEDVRRKGFSYFDIAVCDAIYTLQKYHREKITLTDILRVMAADEKVRLFYQKEHPQKRELRLTESLYKLMYTGIMIDFSEEVKKRNLKDSEGNPLTGLAAGLLVPLEKDEARNCYWFQEGKSLPVYQYAETIRQIISIPSFLLAPENCHFSNTDEVILMKRILVQRLEIMRNGKNNLNGRKIRYYGEGKEEGILPLIGICKDNFSKEQILLKNGQKVRTQSRSWKNKVHEVDKKICAILDAYKSWGYIEDYEPLRNGPRELVRGVEIKGEIRKLSADYFRNR